ncbi:hypothetical protein IX307_000518 [Bacteroides pyogenes]|nr:hypothetical protein [Bacteroides pyogenes]MBR8724587.1 hypothetical protein [Bacteroides pyogenes]MBR8738326.1 hypothetical protein [Bacteroides pyogenes]MBR8753940.1 hypothetical protein [Bacteroides pyogenes]MBR8786215.1 hypothetical protein [Bacteroides pyogenes]
MLSFPVFANGSLFASNAPATLRSDCIVFVLRLAGPRQRFLGLLFGLHDVCLKSPPCFFQSPPCLISKPAAFFSKPAVFDFKARRVFFESSPCLKRSVPIVLIVVWICRNRKCARFVPRALNPGNGRFERQANRSVKFD